MFIGVDKPCRGDHRSSVTTAVNFMVRGVEDVAPYTHDIIYFPLCVRIFFDFNRRDRRPRLSANVVFAISPWRTTDGRPYTDHLTDKHQFIAKIYAIPENK